MIRELLSWRGQLLPGFGLFSSPKPNIGPEPDPVPTREDPEVARKAEQDRMAAVYRKGLVSTRKSKGTGVSSSPNTRRARALGEGGSTSEAVS